MKINVKNLGTNEVVVREAKEDPFGALILDMYLDGINGRVLVELDDEKRSFKLTQTSVDRKTEGKTEKNLTFIWDYVNKVDDRTYEPPVIKTPMQKFVDGIKEWVNELLEEESAAQMLDKQKKEKEKNDKTV